MDDETSISDVETVDLPIGGEENPPFAEESIDAKLSDEMQLTLDETSTISADRPLKTCVEQNTTEDDDAIPVFELHLSDGTDSCQSKLSTVLPTLIGIASLFTSCLLPRRLSRRTFARWTSYTWRGRQ